MAIIVYGPIACGKTHNAEKLKLALRCERVIDGMFSLSNRRLQLQDDQGRRFSTVGGLTLILTNMNGEDAMLAGLKLGVRSVMTFEDAMRLIGVENQAVEERV